MAHTLNEQVVVIPSGTAADNIELIIDAIVELTGWYRDGYTVYCDTQHTMGIRFLYTGSATCRAEGFFNGSVILDYTNITLTSANTIRVHKSTDESVTFVDAGNPYLCLIYALNENGTGVLMQAYSQQFIAAGTPGKETAQNMYMPYNTTGRTYCITKMPDALNGSVFRSLYMVVGTASPAEHNQLVNFDGDIFRIAFLGNSYSTSCIGFAFPVSDE